MTKILFISYAGVFGGAERVLLDCAAALDGPHLLACPEGPLANRARAAGLTVLTLAPRSLDVRAGIRNRLLAPVRLAAHSLELRALARDLKPDLVIAWGMRSAIACLSASRAQAFAIDHHDFLPGSWTGALVRAAAARAAVVTVPSHAVAADLDRSGRLASRLRIVRPGVDCQRFVDIGPAPEAANVLVLGAIAGWKRPDLALEICALARHQQPELTVRFVGAPVTATDATLAALGRRAGYPDLAGAVQIAGPRTDPRTELARCSVLLHCAPREPFGIVLLEAMAAGRPVIAPDTAGPREIVDRSCGRLYRALDTRAAAAALVEVCSDRAAALAMGAAGRRRAAEQFPSALTQAGFADALGPLARVAQERFLRAKHSRAFGSTEASPDQIEIVTVTHNSAAELRTLIESVQHHLPGAKLTVVDCASRDDSVAVTAAWPWVRTIALGENVGFGRACNRGVREARGLVTVLLNPDVELVDDSLLGLANEALREDRPDRILAPLILNRDGSRQQTAHPSPSSPADLVAALVPPTLLPGRMATALAPWRATRARAVGWAVGAALVARTATLRRLGPFDEAIFMYGEDTELGLRARQQGVLTWFWPGARVLHTGAHATEASFGGEPFGLVARGRHNAVAKRLGSRRALLDDRIQAVTFASRIALKQTLRRPAERQRRQLAALRTLSDRGW